MLQNKKISIVYRIICLIIFVIVTLKVNNFITLSLLTIALYLFTRNEDNSLVSLWHLITIIGFLISYFTGIYLILKIVLIIDLCYYFLSMPSSYVVIKEKETIIMDKYFWRFVNKKNERKDIISNNLLCTMYVTAHLLILFITIMVGSCAI